MIRADDRLIAFVYVTIPTLLLFSFLVPHRRNVRTSSEEHAEKKYWKQTRFSEKTGKALCTAHFFVFRFSSDLW